MRILRATWNDETNEKEEQECTSTGPDGQKPILNSAVLMEHRAGLLAFILQSSDTRYSPGDTIVDR
jgi:hypothetical protein